MRQRVKKKSASPNGITKMVATSSGRGSGLGTRCVSTTTLNAITTAIDTNQHHLHDVSTCRKTSPPPKWRVQWPQAPFFYHHQLVNVQPPCPNDALSFGPRLFQHHQQTKRPKSVVDALGPQVCFFISCHF